ncbi:DDE-type integrase/transposase/recombinase [Funiculus sociatus]|uniref:DDE-type integrase/transposase/recombinase n=1 Tax=Funiculus sociatus TaxID=450527 RepID=UPI003D660AF3
MCRKVLRTQHTQAPLIFRNARCCKGIKALKGNKTLAAETELQQRKYSNNVIEQDYRNIQRITKLIIGFKLFNTARRMLRSIGVMSIIHKG